MGTEPAHAFRLTPQEDFVHGVSLVGTTLRFKASGPRLIEIWAMAIIGFAIAVGLVAAWHGSRTTVVGVEMGRSAIAIAVGALLAGAVVGCARIRLRAGVTATPTGLVLRRPLTRVELAWPQVSDIRAVDNPRQHWSVHLGDGGLGIRPRAVTSWSTGIVVRSDGVVLPLPTVVAASSGEGLSLGDPTTTEVKVDVLRRYRAELVGPWPVQSQGAP